MRHHFQDHHYGFGVSSPLWDVVFRTLPRRRRVEKRAPEAGDAPPPPSAAAQAIELGPRARRARRSRCRPRGGPSRRASTVAEPMCGSSTQRGASSSSAGTSARPRRHRGQRRRACPPSAEATAAASTSVPREVLTSTPSGPIASSSGGADQAPGAGAAGRVDANDVRGAQQLAQLQALGAEGRLRLRLRRRARVDDAGPERVDELRSDPIRPRPTTPTVEPRSSRPGRRRGPSRASGRRAGPSRRRRGAAA